MMGQAVCGAQPCKAPRGGRTAHRSLPWAPRPVVAAVAGLRGARMSREEPKQQLADRSAERSSRPEAKGSCGYVPV